MPRRMLERYSHIRIVAKRDAVAKLEGDGWSARHNRLRGGDKQGGELNGLRHNPRHNRPVLALAFLAYNLKKLVGGRGLEPRTSCL